MTEESVAKLKEFKANLEKIDSEQEKLKTALKLKTEELNKTKDDALKLYFEYRKLVKIKIDQKSWGAFGIEGRIMKKLLLLTVVLSINYSSMYRCWR